jgi:mitochondrial distribution and morphology protein 12
MSIDLNWETLTGGSDGVALAESIRDFIHTKFQRIQLPRFIKSVTVHDFQFGTIPPEVVLKDITSPLPDFYEEDAAADELDPEGSYPGDESEDGNLPDAIRTADRRRPQDRSRREANPDAGPSAPATSGAIPPYIHTAGLRSAPGTPADLSNPFLGLGVSTPGIPGGTANMHYFPSHFATGWSGAGTPLAAVAGAQHMNVSSWLDAGHGHSLAPRERAEREHSVQPSDRGRAKSHVRDASQGSAGAVDPPVQDGHSLLLPDQPLKEKHSVSTLAPTTLDTSRPPTRDGSSNLPPASATGEHDEEAKKEEEEVHKYREPRAEDLQAVFRIKYAGDVKLILTAEILFDYPMPSFVGIPLKLNVTGLSFDGVGLVANIRKRVHFCFLSPEDALAAVGKDDDSDEDGDKRGRMGGLLQEIQVESEIGGREGSKQSLKNVGKVERFVLEQVRRIFEEEFVYPSFWTFLV